MALDVKKDVFDILRDESLSKSDKVSKIMDLYNRVGGKSPGSGARAGNSALNGNGGGSNGEGQGQGGNQSDNGQSGNGSQNGQGQPGNQNGQGQSGNQNGQGQGQGQPGNQNSQGQGNSQSGNQNGQGQGQSGNQNGNQNSQGQGGNQGNQSGNQNGQGQGQGQGQSGNQNGQGQQQSGQNNQQQGGNGQGNNQGQQSQNQNQNGQGQGQPITDPKEIGRILGRQYAEEMFKHHGLAPIMRDVMELPELEPMSIKESLNESQEDDISSILDDDLTDDEKVKKIHDLFFNDGTNSTTNNTDELEPVKKTEVPEDVIVMRNGSVGKDTTFTGDHVISQTIGDEIRKEQGVVPKDPDFGLSSDEAAMIKEAFPLIDDVFAKAANSGDDELEEEAENMKEKIKGRIRRSREGIINWKEALAEFVSSKSKHQKKAGLRKNIYKRTGIGLYHRERDLTNYNKCVFYIDTSGSVNNDETQLIPVMVGEIGKVMQDCHFNTVDIHLFAGSVYNEHFDVDSYTVRDEDWGLEGVSSGGTSINNVYKHIIKHYTDDGTLNNDIDAIIIITDVSGMNDSGNVKKFKDALGTETLTHMLYVIYDDYKGYLAEINEAMGELVAEESTYFVIPLAAFKKQILDESMKVNKKKRLVEALGGAKSVMQKKAEATQPVADRTDQQKEERLKKSAIQGARALGTLDQVLPELVAKLNELFPDCNAVKEMTAVITTPNTYYISDNVTVVLNKSIPASLSQFFMEACKDIDFEAIIGDVTIEGVMFSQFPKNFPKQIKGDFTIRNTKYLRSFDNAPTVVTGALHLDVITINSRKITDAMIQEYANKVSNQMKINNIDGGKGIVTAFGANESADEMQNIIRKRILLGESFVNERFGGLLDKPKGQKHGHDQNKWDVYNKNKEVFAKLREYITIPWGDIPEDKINVRNTVKDIRDAITKITNVDDINVARKGITVLTDENGKISVVLANDGKDKSKSKIIYFRDYETGEDIYDPQIISDEIESRYNAYNEVTKTLTDIGVDPKYISEKIERLGKTTLEICALGHLFQGLLYANGVTAKDYGKNILYPNHSGTDEEYVNEIMTAIYGPKTERITRTRGNQKFDDSFHVEVKGKKTTVNLGSDNTNTRDIFVGSAELCLRENQANIFQYMSDEYLKAMLKGISIRAIDNYPTYTLDSVDAMTSHQDLADMAYSLKEVLIENTALKQQSYTKDLKKKDDASRVLLLFPERMNDMYYFNVDVKPLTVDYMSSVMNRIAKPSDDRRKGEKESRSVTARRSALDAVNAERAKNGQKPLTYMEYKQDIIESLRDSFNTNVKNITKDGALSDILEDTLLDKVNTQFGRGDKKTADEFIENIDILPGAIDYLGEILDPKNSNTLVRLFSPDAVKGLIDQMSDFRKNLDDSVNETDANKFVEEIKVINEFTKYIITLVNIVLAGDSRTQNISGDTLKDTLATRTDELRVSAKTADTQTAQTTATVNQKNAELYKEFGDDIAAIEGSIPGIIAAIKGIDFTQLDPKIVQRVRGGKQGLIATLTDDAGETLRLAKAIYADAMNNGTPTGAFNWIISTSSDIKQLAKDCEAIVELANNSNVVARNLIRAITSIDTKFYDMSTDLSDYDNSVAQQAFAEEA